MSEKVQCPNCLEPAEKVGNKITCQACDSVLTITRTGGAKVEKIGWKEELENRVKVNEDRLAGLLGGDEPEPHLEPGPDAEPDKSLEIDEEDILPR